MSQREESSGQVGEGGGWEREEMSKGEIETWKRECRHERVWRRKKSHAWEKRVETSLREMRKMTIGANDV